MVEKFRWLAGFVMEEQAAEAVLKMLFDFSTLTNVRELTGQIQEAGVKKSNTKDTKYTKVNG